MARPTWKGNITFGLVNIPVSVYPGEKRTDLSFRMLDSRDNARVRYERVNEVTGEEVPWDMIVKGFEYDENNYILLTDEDFEQVAVEATQTVDIEDFVMAAEIAIPFFDKPYILVPSKPGRKAYVLLREALKSTNKIGIAKVVIRTRQYLAAVMPQDDALLLCLLRFANELRDVGDYELPSGELGSYKITSKEVDMATQLIESMTSKWKPSKYRDEYSEALQEWIAKKVEAGDETPAVEPAEEKKPAGKIINIMDLLKKSMEKNSRKGGDAEAEEKSSVGTRKKKAAAKPANTTKLKTAAKAKAKRKAPAKSKAKTTSAPAAKRKAS